MSSTCKCGLLVAFLSLRILGKHYGCKIHINSGPYCATFTAYSYLEENSPVPVVAQYGKPGLSLTEGCDGLLS